MFGYLSVAQGGLTEAQLARYRACYCGLCRALGKGHGELARLTLNYDLTFLVLLLSSLYEPEEASGDLRCAAHPMQAHAWWENEFTAYAADMNIMLSYLKCRDDWQDDARLGALAASAALRGAYSRLGAQYPRQHEAMTQALERLSVLEHAGDEDADAASAAFGALMAEAFVYREDRWSADLRAMGDALGRFIYVMDAALDLSSDTFHGRYNPFRRYYGLDNEQRFRDILKLLMAECVYYFDKLPLVQDADILKNILCFGLWRQFDAKFSKGKGKSTDVSGPV